MDRGKTCAAIPCTASTRQNTNAPAAITVIHKDANDRGTPQNPPSEKWSDQMGPEKMFNDTTVNPSAAPSDAAFARNSVRARTGSGPRTSTSRRSGNVESQLSTANNPTTSM